MITPRLLRLATGLLFATTIAPAGAAQTPSRAPAPALSPSILVSSAWLSARLADPRLVILHVGTRADYDAAHIAGSRYVDLTQLSRATTTSESAPALSLEMLSADSLRAALQALGISNDSRVVVAYVGDRVPQATRIVLTLDYAGLGDSTSLLDGGVGAWTRAGLPVSADAVPPRVGTLAPLRINPLVVSAEWARAHASVPGTVLVDARLVGFFDGTDEAGPRDARRRGHIPGAVNVPFSALFDERFEWRSRDVLAGIFSRAGVRATDTVVVYCHIGQQATATIFAARLLGHPVRLFDGSFEEWARRGWPVDTARTPR